MNTTPRLCVELNGCIADNFGFMGEPRFELERASTPPILAALEALAWLNSPFAFADEVHVTIKSEDSAFYENAMQWLESEYFFVRTGLPEDNIHCYETLDELARLASGMRPTIAVCAQVEPLLQFLLADLQLLLDPHNTQHHEFHEIRKSIRGSGIIRVTNWHQIVQYCSDSLSPQTPA